MPEIITLKKTLKNQEKISQTISKVSGISAVTIREREKEIRW